MTRSEKIVVALGLIGIIKPCCLIFWSAMLLGSTSSVLGVSIRWLAWLQPWAAWMMPYEKYFMFFTLVNLVVAQYHIWTALVRRLMNPLKTPWKNWVVKFVTIQSYTTIFVIAAYFYPAIIPWNMGH